MVPKGGGAHSWEPLGLLPSRAASAAPLTKLFWEKKRRFGAQPGREQRSPGTQRVPPGLLLLQTRARGRLPAVGAAPLRHHAGSRAGAGDGEHRSRGLSGQQGSRPRGRRRAAGSRAAGSRLQPPPGAAAAWAPFASRGDRSRSGASPTVTRWSPRSRSRGLCGPHVAPGLAAWGWWRGPPPRRGAQGWRPWPGQWAIPKGGLRPPRLGTGGDRGPSFGDATPMSPACIPQPGSCPAVGRAASPAAGHWGQGTQLWGCHPRVPSLCPLAKITSCP